MKVTSTQDKLIFSFINRHVKNNQKKANRGTEEYSKRRSQKYNRAWEFWRCSGLHNHQICAGETHPQVTIGKKRQKLRSKMFSFLSVFQTLSN